MRRSARSTRPTGAVRDAARTATPSGQPGPEPDERDERDEAIAAAMGGGRGELPISVRRKGAARSRSQEPVSGFEPLTCRLQDGCSAN